MTLSASVLVSTENDSEGVLTLVHYKTYKQKNPALSQVMIVENLPENRYSVVAHRHTILKVISVFGEITHISLSKHGIDNR